MPAPKGERIAKVMARAGVCSRRQAEAWIEAGRVKVNGETLTSPAFCVESHAKILIDGKPLPQRETTQLWLYHKPKGLVTTHKDTEGRPTVFEALPKDLPRVISVGRLDLNSEGLLLLTNDGELARSLELPATGWERVYRVRVFGTVDPALLQKIEGGITIDDIRYGPIKTRIDRQQGGNAWLTVSLREGKNREIRRIFEYLGYPVNRLIRQSYGPFELGDLALGEIKEIPFKTLKHHLGSFLEF
ncbi:MAG: pseudouridine synthase [Nitrospiria bacterium]